MASKKAQQKPLLYLHCKCEACKAWELVYDPNKNEYYLKCASCGELIPVYIDLGKPHPLIHWEK